MMHLLVYVAVVLLNPNNAKSQFSFGISKLGAERSQYEGVIDMDALMDTHYPPPQMNPLPNGAFNELSGMKCKPQVKSKIPLRNVEVVLPESGTGERVFAGSVRIPPQDISGKFISTEAFTTGIPGVSLEPNTIPPVLRKLFLEHGNLTKRGFLSNVHLFSNLHKSRASQRSREKPPSSWTDHSTALSNGDNILAPKVIPPHLQSLEDPKAPHLTSLGKRSADKQKKSKNQPTNTEDQEVQVRKSRNAQEQEKWKWAEWHSVENPKTVHISTTFRRKRNANGRRMRISDIWNKPKKETTHEEVIKIVLPLLLSEMKESVKDPKKPIVLIPSKTSSADRVHNPVNGSTSKSSETLPAKIFRIKTDDGKEFSFSASVNDPMHQLLSLLTKPDSVLMVEKVNSDKPTNETTTTPPCTKKTTNQSTVRPEHKKTNCRESIDILEMKEFETDVLENVLQVDIPIKTATTGAYSEQECVATTGAASGSDAELTLNPSAS